MGVKMVTEDQIRHYEEKGYVVLDGVLDVGKLKVLRRELAKMILRQLDTHLPDVAAQARAAADPEEFLVHKGMLALDKHDHEALIEIYNTLPKSTPYFQVVYDDAVVHAANRLLRREESEGLYANSTTIRMDTPGITPFLYGWHRDNNTNLPGSHFIQFWAPVIGDLTEKEGAIWVALDTHKQEVLTTRTKGEQSDWAQGVPVRSGYDTEILGGPFKEVCLELRWGQCLFFQNSLVHKSGLNSTTDRMRYVMSVFLHDVYYPGFKYKNLDQKR